MNENEFEFEGIKLKAKEISISLGCENCYFHNWHCNSLVNNKLIPSCIDSLRKDGKEVIFVEVE